MADHQIDIILRARDQASRAIQNVNRSLGTLGVTARRGVATAARNLARLGAVAAGVGAGLGVVAIRNGIESLASLENATTSVDGAIRRMGFAGRVTSQQIAQWANEIESDVQAAFDDKDITAATATLIRFGKLTPKNIRPAMQVMTDLAVKTGSVESASSTLAKALADPTKAAGKLARAGVILTKEEQKKITALVKSGKLARAQDFILRKLAQTTKNAAKNSVGPYGDALNQLGDAGEDASRLLATGFMPVIQKVARGLNDALLDPKVQGNLKAFGQALAGAFDSAVEFARKIPWDKVGAGLQTAADFAGKLIGVFTSMPPEVQGTIIALAGLNKLSGGAITGIVGELGKGLIKGVLGMTAGVVNINAGIVNGGGPDLPGGGKVPPFVPPGVTVPAIGAGAFIPDLPAHKQWVRDVVTKLEGKLPGGGGTGTLRNPGEIALDNQQKLDAIHAAEQESIAVFRSGERTTEQAGRGVESTTISSGMTITAAVNLAATRITAAVNALNLVPKVTVNVGAESSTKSQTTQRRSGGGTTSRNPRMDRIPT